MEDFDKLDQEIDAMKTVKTALQKIEDIAARKRILTWATQTFLGGAKLPGAKLPVDDEVPDPPSPLDGCSSESEVAVITPSGELKITARDLKARNKNDAAVRLAHIAIKSWETLKGEEWVSSRKVVTPLLKYWRVYDGNTRKALKEHNGIIRDGDNLSLDRHSRQDAEKYIAEIIDPAIEGNWKPNNGGRASSRKPNLRKNLKDGEVNAAL